MTVIKQLNISGTDSLIIPEPSYILSFLGENVELKDNMSAWKLFDEYTLPRIEKYQDKGDVATWEEADIYLKDHGF